MGIVKSAMEDEIIQGDPTASKRIVIPSDKVTVREEALGLRWEDIDVPGGLIHVRRNVTYPENQPTIGTPKSRNGFHSVPLDDTLLQCLQPLQETGFIFGRENPLSNQAFRNRWIRIEKVIDLHGATPHILRHSYLTFLAGTGMDIKTV